MDDKESTEEGTPGLSLQDIVFIFFRHQWKIFGGFFIGLLAAIGFYLLPATYESQAKLLVRYVVDRSAIDPVDAQARSANSQPVGDGVITSEVEILNSKDLAMQVAAVIDEGKALPHGMTPEKHRSKLAKAISDSLKVSSIRGTNVIEISYKDSDPNRAQRVLEELVSRYFDKHLQVHRSLGAFGFVTQQTEQVRSQLHQTEDQLKDLKGKAGVTTLAASTASLTAALDRIRNELQTAEVQRAEQGARVKELEFLLGGSGGYSGTEGSTQAAQRRDDLQEYQVTLTQLTVLHQREVELRSRYTSEHRAVRINREQIEALERQQRALESRSPGVGAAAAATVMGRNTAGVGGQNQELDLVTERARLAAYEARAEALKLQLGELNQRVAGFADVGTEIAKLERKKELAEANYRYFEQSLERARVDEALDPSKMPNISVVQKPSEAVKFVKVRNKVLLGLLFGGLVTGVGMAFAMELLLDRTVKRTAELEAGLGIPVMVTVPLLQAGKFTNFARLANGNATTQARVSAASRDMTTAIWPYFEAVRDRLILYFELRRMHHKPKLVAVTSPDAGSGTSTMAAGLAAVLSDSGDANVLLVDMKNEGRAVVHPFFEGKEALPLGEALQYGSDADFESGSLALATITSPGEAVRRFIPKKFYDMIPEFKASQYDYIIFDMPPLNQTSATLPMAGFMDKVLLVVEAEKTDRELVKRAYADLAEAKAKVSVIFNKGRSYIPSWLRV
jgi:succinoglycan biosynthesis transport protein ExoP